MNWVHIIAVLFALIAVVPAVTLLSPVKVPHRVIPLLMIVVSLSLWFAPTGVAIAIGLVPIAAWISSRLGIEHAGHEPVDVTKAVELAKKTAQRIQERIRKPEPLTVTEFATKAYPNPADEDDEPDDAEDDEDEPDESPAEAVTVKLDELLHDPALPAGAQARLAGQRQGRDTSGGLRDSTVARVPSYVPAL
jgi:hypothetical protein